MADHTSRTTELEPEWLDKVCKRAAAEVASWPQWMRDHYRAVLALGQPDPCHRRRACAEAQTCVGGCVYGSRH